MGYGRLGSSESIGSLPESIGSLPQPQLLPNQIVEAKSKSPKRKHKLIILAILSLVLLVASAISAVLLVELRPKSSPGSEAVIQRKPTQAISRTCSKTRYPNLCVNSLLDFPGALSAGERDLVHISFNMTLQRVGKALYDVSKIANFAMETRVRSAYEDCFELLEESLDQLSRSLTTVAPSPNVKEKPGSTQDVMTWLSAALTNQDTCTEGFSDVSGYVKDQMGERLRDLSELVSNCLALYAFSSGDEDFSGIPIQNRRRLLERSFPEKESGFPAWMTRRDRRLLDMPVAGIQADIVVSKDGNGTYKTIAEAIKAAPDRSNRRTIIHVRAGWYNENVLKVGRKKTNLMFIGDGKDKTVISGGKSVFDNVTTFHTATFGKCSGDLYSRLAKFGKA